MRTSKKLKVISEDGKKRCDLEHKVKVRKDTEKKRLYIYNLNKAKYA